MRFPTTLAACACTALATFAACGEAGSAANSGETETPSAPQVAAPQTDTAAPPRFEEWIRSPGAYRAGDLVLTVRLEADHRIEEDGTTRVLEDLFVEGAWSAGTPERPERLAHALRLKAVKPGWFIHPDERDTTLWCFDGDGVMGILRIETEDRAGEAIFVTLDEGWGLDHRVPEAFEQALPEAVRARSGG